MAKMVTVVWIPGEDPDSNHKSEIARSIKMSLMCVDGKVNPLDFKVTEKFTTQRRWRDQESVDEYIKFLYELETRYGGKLVKIDVEDVD
jgi:hypothetical protein